MDLARLILRKSHLSYDQQPAILKIFQTLLAYSSWIVLGLIFVVDMIKKSFAKSISFFLGLVIAFLGFFGYLISRPVVSDYAQRAPFDSTSWKNEKLSTWETPTRLRMVDDLLKRYDLTEMSKEEINDLLGIPKQTDYFKDYDYVYWLGPERGFISIDFEWLGIKFRHGVVVEATLLRD